MQVLQLFSQRAAFAASKKTVLYATFLLVTITFHLAAFAQPTTIRLATATGPLCPPPSITGGYYTSAPGGESELSSGINIVCGYYSNPSIYLNLQGVNEISNVTISGTPPTPAWGYYGNYIYFDGFSEEGQSLTFAVTVANSCGSETYNYTFVQSNCSGFASAEPVSVYPNPASQQISINLKK